MSANGVPHRFLAKYSVAVTLWRTLEFQALAGVPLEEPLLDLGCGDGFFTSMLLGRTVGMGLDLAMPQLRRAKAKGIYRGLVRGDAGHLAFRDGYFKTVFSNSVLEHIERLDESLVEVSRVLAPGGRLVMTVPNSAFGEWLLIRNIFEALGFAHLGGRYASWVNARFAHRHLLALERWQEKLQEVRLRVVLHRHYVGKANFRMFELFLAPRWLSSKMERALGRPGLLPRRLVQFLFGPCIVRIASSPAQEGCGLMLVAEKI